MIPFVWAVLGHNGVVHKPGESSAIGISSAFVDGCDNSDCYTIYNYGQNYVKLVQDGVVTELDWPKEYLPVAASVVGHNTVLASVDDDTRIKFVLVYPNGNEIELTEPDGCPDPEHMVKFIDTLEDGKPTVLDLKDGAVYVVNIETPRCEKKVTFPGTLVGKPLMFDGATVYGYAETDAARCWFYGVEAAGAVIECYNPTTDVKLFKSAPLNDGHADPTNIHTGGDIFFDGSCLYAVNGETNPGSLRDTEVQFEDHLCGKLLKWCNVESEDAILSIVGVGLRHPWTSVGLSRHRRLIADVGQETSEEVSMVSLNRPTRSIVNFGWPKFEGDVLRGAVVPYNPKTVDATIVHVDRHREKALDTYDFVMYILLFASVAGVLIVFAVRKAAETYQVFALLTLILVGLPLMTAAPNYVGHDNGVYATHVRTLIPYGQTDFAEWYVMSVFLTLTVTLIPLGAALGVWWTVAIGNVSALVYLITFIVLVEAPAAVTPLVVLAFCGIVFLGYLLWKRAEGPTKYAPLSSDAPVSNWH